MPSLQNDGRIGETEIFINLPIYFGWGRGLPEWDEIWQPEPVDSTALVDEVGRRLATQVQYVVPDDSGEIELPEGRYRVSQVPTRWAHVRVVFDYEDAAGETIREVAIFYGTEINDGLPEGQRYFSPEQIKKSGRVKVLHHLEQKIVRQGGVRQTFEYILPF